MCEQQQRPVQAFPIAQVSMRESKLCVTPRHTPVVIPMVSFQPILFQPLLSLNPARTSLPPSCSVGPGGAGTDGQIGDTEGG